MTEVLDYSAGRDRIAALRGRIAELRREMREAQAAISPQRVQDYDFVGADGPARLSDLFGERDSLFVVHNMGAQCPNCTLWADGYNGVYPQLARRAAFVVASPDAPEAQRRLAAARGWRFPMVCDARSTFAADTGFVGEGGRRLPGVSAFERRDGAIWRVSDAGFHPLDDFCVVWHLLELLPDGAAGWRAEPSGEGPASG